MSDKPKRFKDREDWTVDDIVRNQRTGELPENPEWRQARADALERAGLLTDDDRAAADPPDPEEATVDDHLRRIQGRS